MTKTEIPKKIYLVTDSRTHQLIGIFDEQHSDKFFTPGNVLMDGKLYIGGVKFAKNEYASWNLTLNKEYTDSRIRVSKSRVSNIKKKEGF